MTGKPNQPTFLLPFFLSFFVSFLRSLFLYFFLPIFFTFWLYIYLSIYLRILSMSLDYIRWWSSCSQILGNVVGWLVGCMSHFPGQMLGCAYTICSYGQISISCSIPGGPPWPPSRVSSYTLSVLICCIRLLCDWWFRLYHHITYICCFVASYLFLLWYDWFLWCYFCLLSEEIPFVP